MAAYQVGHHMATLEALLPGPFSLANSLKNAIATGRSIPTPSPMTKRAPASTYSFGASAQAIAATTKNTISAIKTR